MNKRLIKSIILTLSIVFSLFYSSNVQAMNNEDYNVVHVDKTTLTAEQQNKIEKVDGATVEECTHYTVVYEKEMGQTAKLPNTGIDSNIEAVLALLGLFGVAAVVVKRKNSKILIALLVTGAILSLPLAKISAKDMGEVLKTQQLAVGSEVKPLVLKGYKFVGIIKEKHPCEIVPEKPMTPPVPKKVETKIPSDAPKVEKEALKTTRHLIDGTTKELAAPELGFVGEKTGIIEKDGNKYQYANKTEETEDVRTHWYKKVETKIPSDAPKVEKEMLKTTRHLIEGTMKELAEPELGFVGEKTGIIEKDGNKYQYANNTQETEDVRTHWYKALPKKNKDAKVNVWLEIYYKGHDGIIYPVFKQHKMGEYPVYKKVENSDELKNVSYEYTLEGVRAWGQENIKEKDPRIFNYDYVTFDSIVKRYGKIAIKENSDLFNGTFEEGKDVHLKLLYEGPLIFPQ